MPAAFPINQRYAAIACLTYQVSGASEAKAPTD
jgi:hypothetical protein